MLNVKDDDGELSLGKYWEKCIGWGCGIFIVVLKTRGSIVTFLMTVQRIYTFFFFIMHTFCVK